MITNVQPYQEGVALVLVDSAENIAWVTYAREPGNECDIDQNAMEIFVSLISQGLRPVGRLIFTNTPEPNRCRTVRGQVSPISPLGMQESTAILEYAAINAGIVPEGTKPIVDSDYIN
jgi:hypothetical protein